MIKVQVCIPKPREQPLLSRQTWRRFVSTACQSQSVSQCRSSDDARNSDRQADKKSSQQPLRLSGVSPGRWKKGRREQARAVFFWKPGHSPGTLSLVTLDRRREAGKVRQKEGGRRVCERRRENRGGKEDDDAWDQEDGTRDQEARGEQIPIR